jgi:hypothetical protein
LQVGQQTLALGRSASTCPRRAAQSVPPSTPLLEPPLDPLLPELELLPPLELPLPPELPELPLLPELLPLPELPPLLPSWPVAESPAPPSFDVAVEPPHATSMHKAIVTAPPSALMSSA